VEGAFSEEAVSRYAEQVTGNERDPYSLIDEIVSHLVRKENDQETEC
jgi:16S rRNA G966 N2-methylase RsmD